MKSTPVSSESTDMTRDKSSHCAECGWPGIGEMPAGVRRIREDGKDLLIGQLTYHRTSDALCSVCQAMEVAVASRLWFVEAHAEYLDEVKAKKRLLEGQ